MPILRGFVAAMGFLTRFGPSGGGRVGDFAASVPWFPVVGLVLGAVLTAPVALGLFAGEQWFAPGSCCGRSGRDPGAARGRAGRCGRRPGKHGPGGTVLRDSQDSRVGAFGSWAFSPRFRESCPFRRPVRPGLDRGRGVRHAAGRAARSGSWAGRDLVRPGLGPVRAGAGLGTASWFWA